MSTAERVVSMANQIARNIAVQAEPDPAAATAGHMRAFWDRRMKALLAAHLAAGGEGLDPVAREAAALLAAERHAAPAASGD